MRLLSLCALASSLSLLTKISFANFNSTSCKTPDYRLEYTKEDQKLHFSYITDTNKIEKKYVFDKGEISWEEHYMIFESYKRALSNLQANEKILEKNPSKLARLRSNVKALHIMVASRHYQGLRIDSDPNHRNGLYKYYDNKGKLVGTISKLDDWTEELTCE